MTLQSIQQGIIRPRAVFIFGFPYHWAKAKFDIDLAQILSQTAKAHPQISFYIFQKPLDPAIGFVDLQEILEEAGALNLPNVSLTEYRVAGEPTKDHHYASVDKIAEIIRNIL